MSAPAERYRQVGDRIGRALCGVGAFAAFNLVAGALLAVSVNASGYFVGLITAELFLLGAGPALRSWLALHAKIDALVAALPQAPNALIRAEERDAAEIEELRR